MQSHPIVSRNYLPSSSSIVFENSSFFSRHGPNAVLPTPPHVFAKSQAASESPPFEDYRSYPPVFFNDLGLFAKLGKAPRVTIAEGQTLWALRQLAPIVPVPEIYGWAQDGDVTYLYMELVQGVTIHGCWTR
jgi:aminoglycoside phosphotransferase